MPNLALYTFILKQRRKLQLRKDARIPQGHTTTHGRRRQDEAASLGPCLAQPLLGGRVGAEAGLSKGPQNSPWIHPRPPPPPSSSAHSQPLSCPDCVENWGPEHTAACSVGQPATSWAVDDILFSHLGRGKKRSCSSSTSGRITGDAC